MLCIEPCCTAKYLYPAFTLRPSLATLWVSDIRNMGIFQKVWSIFFWFWRPDFWESPLFSSSLSLLPIHYPDSIDLPENPDLLFLSLGRRSIFILLRLPKPFHLFPDLSTHAWLLLFPLPRKPSLPSGLLKIYRRANCSSVDGINTWLHNSPVVWPWARHWLHWAPVCYSSNRGFNQRMSKRQENKISRNNV